MNINESLTRQLKALREAAKDIERKNNIDFDDNIEYNDSDDLEFGESEVKAGTEFNDGYGNYKWSKPYSDITDFDDSQIQIWSAVDIDTDDEVYFIVDIETGFVEYGPSEDLESAEDYMQDIIDGDFSTDEFNMIDDEDFEDAERLDNDDYSEDEYDLDFDEDEDYRDEDSWDDYADKIKEESLTEDLFVLVPNDTTGCCTEEEVCCEPCCDESCGENCVEETAKVVMDAYQTANKWLDSVKESVYHDMSCVFFSSYIHNLAHTMPLRFDKFGDILHTVNLKIPYPATAEIVKEPENIDEVFIMIFGLLDTIKQALNNFIKCTDEQYHGMACAAEVLLNDIESEYPMLYRLKSEWEQCQGDNIKFDKYVNQYVKNKDDLLEALMEDRVFRDRKDDDFKIEDRKGHLRKARNKEIYTFPDEGEADEFIRDNDSEEI